MRTPAQKRGNDAWLGRETHQRVLASGLVSSRSFYRFCASCDFPTSLLRTGGVQERINKYLMAHL